jgi:hypothetical protein
MKRTISYMNAGHRADGSEWYLLVFACQLIGDTLYDERKQFVTKSIYDACKVGQELKLA